MKALPWRGFIQRSKDKEKTMLFHVAMTVNLPPDMDAERAAALKAEEKAMSQQLQRDGIWRHLWRVAGRYANVSVFDVDSPAHLHDILSQLPLFPYMQMEVTALCRHASSIRDDDR
jgi:muconolactone D-isomerase